MTHNIRTKPKVKVPPEAERLVTIEARLGDWIGLHALLDLMVVSSASEEGTRLADEWVRQLDEILRQEESLTA